MVKRKSPKLRSVEKVQAPYKLNNFPKEFGLKLGKEVVYLLATKSNPTIEGKEWEEIFAKCIDAEWKPSNVGLDDVMLGNCAWGAKSVKSKSPSKNKNVRLISGRNSPTYSYDISDVRNEKPNSLGDKILDIWNERVTAVRSYYKHLRTIVLIKSYTLEELVVFENDTVIYPFENYYWEWNKNNNLIGIEKSSEDHKFTWQPHGSQFTILEKVPDSSMIISIKSPKSIDKEKLLSSIGFDSSWIDIRWKSKK